MYCVKCGAANPDGADVSFCQACGARLVSPQEANRPHPPVPVGRLAAGAAAFPYARPAVQYSKAQPIWLFALMMVGTFFIYWPFWTHRTWRHIRDYGEQDLSPTWRTLGLIVPILSLYFMYDQADQVKTMAQRAGCEVRLSPGLVLVAMIVGNVLGAAAQVLHAPAMLSILIPIFFICIPLAFVQRAFNQYWAGAHPDLRQPRGPSAVQAVVLAIAGVWWLLMIAGLLAQL